MSGKIGSARNNPSQDNMDRHYKRFYDHENHNKEKKTIITKQVGKNSPGAEMEKRLLLSETTFYWSQKILYG